MAEDYGPKGDASRHLPLADLKANIVHRLHVANVSFKGLEHTPHLQHGPTLRSHRTSLWMYAHRTLAWLEQP